MPTACPEEASAHADAVVVGEAEDLWPSLVEDARARRLQSDLPAAASRSHRQDAGAARPLPRPPLHSLRGACRPCGAARTHANSAACPPQTAPPCASGRPTTCWPSSRTLGKLIMFADDNVMIHRAYAKDLFTRMIPLRKHWIGQCSLAAVRRLENVQLMAASGCKALFVGFESIDEETTRYTGKKQNRPSEYKETVAHAARARHLRVGQLRLRLRHRRSGGLRADRRVRASR